MTLKRPSIPSNVKLNHHQRKEIEKKGGQALEQPQQLPTAVSHL